MPFKSKGFLNLFILCTLFATCICSHAVKWVVNGTEEWERGEAEGPPGKDISVTQRDKKKSATFQITIHLVDAHLAFKGDDWFN